MYKSVTIICTGVVSSYHLANIYALIESRYRDRSIKLVVGIDNYWGRSIIPSRYFTYGENKFGLIKTDGDVLNILTEDYLQSSEFVFIGVSYVSYLTYFKVRYMYKNNLNCLISFYSIDEGLGSHVLTYFRTMKRQFKESHNKFKFIIYYNARFGLYSILDRIYKIKHNRLYDLVDGEVVVNESFSQCLKETFKSLSKMNDVDVDVDVDDVVIYLDQPLSSLGVCDSYFESVRIPLAITSFSNENKMKPFIKSHPSRSSTAMFLTTLGSTDGCIEELFSHLEGKNVCVIGVTSNALITAKALFDIDSYRLVGKGIDLSPLELNNKVDMFFLFFTKSINIDD